MLLKLLFLGSLLLVGPRWLLAQTTVASGARAETTSTPQPMRDPVDIRVSEALRTRDAIIRNLLERVQELENRLNGTAGAAATPRTLTPLRTAGPAAEMEVAAVSTSAPAATAPATPASAAVVLNGAYDSAERKATEALDQALLVRGGLLLPPGTLELDNTVSYFSASSDHVTVNGFALLPVLVVGDITSQRLRKDILLPTFTARLGLPKKFQFDMTIPYGYELSRTVDANTVQTNQSSFGLGDLQVALSRQLTTEHRHVPDLLANVRLKTTTGENAFDLGSSQTALGSGFYGLQGNLTAAKSSDPVVFFGNMSYSANLPGMHWIPANDPDNPGAMIAGHFRPGDSVGFQLGSILALNPETSMTLGWDQRFTRETYLNGNPIAASYLVEGTLRVGTSYLYAPGRTVDLSFGVCVTPDTPNLQFSVGFPVRRALWGRHGPPMVH